MVYLTNYAAILIHCRPRPFVIDKDIASTCGFLLTFSLLLSLSWLCSLSAIYFSYNTCMSCLFVMLRGVASARTQSLKSSRRRNTLSPSPLSPSTAASLTPSILKTLRVLYIKQIPRKTLSLLLSSSPSLLLCLLKQTPNYLTSVYPHCPTIAIFVSRLIRFFRLIFSLMCRCRAFLQHRVSFAFRLFHNSPPNALFLFSCSCSCSSCWHTNSLWKFSSSIVIGGQFCHVLGYFVPAAPPVRLPHHTPVMSPRPFKPEHLSLSLNSLPYWFAPPASPSTLCDAPAKHQEVSSLCPNRDLVKRRPSNEIP